MKLSKMKRLPKRAGLAELCFEKGILWPDRDGNVILLPEEPEAEFFPLQRGRQFLFLSPNFRNVVFAGTDENPFLVELNPEILAIFRKKRERGFYGALKPEIVKLVEKRFGVVSKRQGDIWAVPIPGSWDEIKFIIALLLGFYAPSYRSWTPKKARIKPIFDTRHTLTGTNLYFTDGETQFAEGTIKAPDHSPLELKGAHLLAQTAHLTNPTEAD